MKELDLKDILDSTSDLGTKKVGYVAVVGRPNAGKSTFLNTLIGEKISIISSIPQTTRNKILSIYNDKDSQIIFVDTPGIHESKKVFNEEINNQAISSLKEADVILHFIDTSRPYGDEEKYIEALLQESSVPVLQVYTKGDLPPQREVSFDDTSFQISSVTQAGFDELREKIVSCLPEGPILFPEEFYTKQSIYFRISEVIREKAFLHTKEELPHSIFVGVEEVDDSDPKIMKIVAYIYTETESQKYIIIGNKGNKITVIGKEARLELEKIFDTKVFLALRAKTKKGWRKDEQFIKKLLL